MQGIEHDERKKGSGVISGPQQEVKGSPEMTPDPFFRSATEHAMGKAMHHPRKREKEKRKEGARAATGAFFLFTFALLACGFSGGCAAVTNPVATGVSVRHLP